MSDGYEPHGLVVPHVRAARAADVAPAVVRGVPGVRDEGDRVGVGRGYTGTQARPSQDPDLTYSKAEALPTAK